MKRLGRRPALKGSSSMLGGLPRPSPRDRPGVPWRRRAGLPAVALVGATVAWAPVPLAAQEPDTPLLRGGQLSLFLSPVVSIYDERFGYRDGADALEPLAYDFATESLGASGIPGLVRAEELLAALARDSSFSLDMGAADARMSSITYTLPLSVSLGIFDWLTVGGTFPFVKRRTEFDLALREGAANVGLSPGEDDPALLAFLVAAQTAVSSVLASVDALCMSAGENDPGCVDGRAFLSNANGFLADLQSAYAEPLFFFETSPAAAMLAARVDRLRADLRLRGDSLLVDSVFVGALPYATSHVGLAEYQRFVTRSEYNLVGAALEDFTSLWELGDVEIWAALRLLQSAEDPATWEAGAPPVDSAGATPDTVPPRGPSIGYLLGIQGLYRLGTGAPDLPGNFLDIGSGDGQDDVEVRVFGRLDLGRRLRTRFDARYGIQLEGEVVKRLSPAHVPLAPITTEGIRPWDPGDYLDVRIAPEFRLTPELSFGARYRYFRRGADTWDFGDTSGLPADQNPALLNEETEQTARYLGVGLTVWPTERARRAGMWPIAISAEYLRASSGSGGKTPKDDRVRVTGRIFFDLW